MDDEQVSREIHELERGLIRDAIDQAEHDLESDDPNFVQRMHRLHRAEMTNALTIMLLLAASAILLTVGYATLSWPSWVAGVVALLASFAIDHHYRHKLG